MILVFCMKSVSETLVDFFCFCFLQMFTIFV